MLLLATSCLQGQPLARAVLSLLALRPDGLQLCPGNHPSPGLRTLLSGLDAPIRYHHGFCWERYRQPVWSDDGQPLVELAARSVHPPRCPPPEGSRAWLARAAAEGWVLEVMPPGWILSDDQDIRDALELGVRLAVDISHLHILRTQGRLSEATLRRLLDADTIDEVHVSDNDGRLDLHRPSTAETPWLPWAQDRGREGVPLVIECYLHRCDDDARRRLMEVVRCR